MTGPGRPIAMAAGEPVSWDELAPMLAEAAGATVLEQLALDRLLTRELQQRGITLDRDATTREQALLEDSLRRGAGVPPEQTSELIEEVKRSRGLGAVRYAALLRRNAMLRALVRDDVRITGEDVRLAYDIRYGTRHRARLILTRTEREAADALARVRGEGRPPEPFTQVAAQASIDTSRFRGGSIGAVSPLDPSFPITLRQALGNLAVGVPSEVLALDGGYGIVMIDETLPPSGERFEDVAPALEGEVVLVRQRALMDRFASNLMRSAGVTVFDPSLAWSWEGRPAARQ